MIRDNRDPTLLMVEISSRRRPGEKLSQAADRLAGAAVPDYGTAEALAAYSQHNGHVTSVNDAFGRGG